MAILWFTISSLSLAAFPSDSHAGGRSVRAAGMAGTGVAIARGLDAARLNPSLLALADNPWLSVGLFSGGANLSNNSVDLGTYNRTVGRTLTPMQQRDLLAAIPGGGLATNADAHASALGVQWRTLALTLDGGAFGFGNLPRDVFELLLAGNAVADSVDFADADGEAIAMASATLSAGVTVAQYPRFDLRVGASFRYFQAFAYGRLREASGAVVTGVSGIRGEGVAVLETAGAGEGAGIDLSTSLRLASGWEFGLCLENAYGRIRFAEDLERTVYTVRIDTLTVESLEDSDDVDDLIQDGEHTQDATPFQVDLPRVLRLGIARGFGRGLVSVELEQGFVTRAGSHDRTRVALGGELRTVDWMLLRAGLAAGGSHGVGASAGVGFDLGVFALDLAAMTHGELLPAGSPRGVGFALGSELRF